ncbi:MAG TPA: tRNA preQ1(34) S-adenosylmethionine ribosyltransferase-isomerase QueA [Xanthobacteraceae bacterium]|jgi:S-adenosylmethionine:tRNA ribosyltransferase-isomerase|nr:tRNA preQ1(34) S-adenosylmethionine ribosyltransferase-isomerase QueA [Xanthobacteraceae bacterium]
MRTDLFDFDLPEDRITLRPAMPRDAAKLLVVRPGAAAGIEDRILRDLPALLRPGDAVVVNDTKVFPANLSGRRIGRGEHEPAITATLIRRLDGARFRALVKPGKRLAVGDVVRFGAEGRVCFLDQLDATVEDKGQGAEGGEVTLSFSFTGAVLDQALAERGDMPLPPYIASRRGVDERDRSDYQTMFAREEGSVAAPTAGLHFTESLIAGLRDRGVDLQRVTLHVGPGTFLPVKADDTADHKMHAEWGSVSAETAAALNATRRAGGRIVTVGSTSLRLLESAAAPDGTLSAYSGDTALFITPGYRFRAADVMLTNFHLPRSTLFMLVAAFCGLDVMKRAYAHAIAGGYRFYSYGDACLLFRSNEHAA